VLKYWWFFLQFCDRKWRKSCNSSVSNLLNKKAVERDHGEWSKYLALYKFIRSRQTQLCTIAIFFSLFILRDVIGLFGHHQAAYVNYHIAATLASALCDFFSHIAMLTMTALQHNMLNGCLFWKSETRSFTPKEKMYFKHRKTRNWEAYLI
jgi:hypothetical protein